MKRVLAALVVFAIIFAVVGLFLPLEYTAKAQMDIPGSVKQVHSLVGNLETWEQWGPWAKSDPDMKITKGPTTGLGATQSWESSEGNGRLVFTAVDPQRGVEYDLFFDQFPKSTAQFAYEPVEEQKTKVTWTMKGKMEMPIVGGYLAWFFKKVISKSFLDGLENIKKIIKQENSESSEKNS